MATIKHFKNDGLFHGAYDLIETEGPFHHWLNANYSELKGVEIFKGFTPSRETRVTEDFKELIKDGEFCVCDTPEELGTALAILSVVLSVAVVQSIPEPELPANVNRQQESPNNQLGARSNQARPLQRIPDIKGRVLSIPDVIQPAYSRYEGAPSKEVEYAYYCVSRNLVSVSDVKDGDTPLQLVTGSAARIYGPNGNPNNGAATISEITGPETSRINRPIYTPFRSNQVNGITLSPDFVDGLLTSPPFDFLGSIGSFFPAGLIISPNSFQGDETTVPEIYQPGVSVNIENLLVNRPGTSINEDLSGIYTVTERINNPIGGEDIVLSPVPDFPFDAIRVVSNPTARLADAKEFTDWFYITKSKCDRALVNIVANNGMYKDDGGQALKIADVEYQIDFQEVDDFDNPVGAIITEVRTISGDNQRLVGSTLEKTFIEPIKFRARAKRKTPRDVDFNGTVVDEIKWEDFYGLVELPNLELGNVTTIQTRTTATTRATSVKNRELNLIATEMLEPYIDESTKGPMAENTSAVQSFIRDSLDPVIGNRSIDEIDIQGLLDLEQDINNYFGNDLNSQFSYTFDSTDITYQDYAQTIFNAINCIAYREGSTIKAIFEKPQTIPAMLFTHRSKIPGSETYTRNFNRSKIPDGVEFKYTDPNTNKTEVIYIPADKSAVNPKKFEIAGIRNIEQATVRANREYNKILNQKQSCEIGVTGEGRYVRPQEMISVVKGTRLNTFDGEVIGQDGLILTVSQDLDFSNGPHSVTLKNDDGTTDNIPCTAGAESNQLVLSVAPQQPIRTGLDQRRTEFSFGNDSRLNSQRWIAQEIDLTDKLNVGIKAINYSDEYYKDDLG